MLENKQIWTSALRNKQQRVVNHKTQTNPTQIQKLNNNIVKLIASLDKLRM